ncbi:hypothetical protein THAOC_17758, partial [Thalassiosira oceanica]
VSLLYRRERNIKSHDADAKFGYAATSAVESDDSDGSKAREDVKAGMVELLGEKVQPKNAENTPRHILRIARSEGIGSFRRRP